MLKSIIVPVDFSDAAYNALLFAAELSKRIRTNLTILHVLPATEDEEEARQKLTLLMGLLKGTFEGELGCNSVIVPGEFINVLGTQVTSHHADLIVMGTKGATGLKRILVGSNTVKVLENTKVPVLIIPEVARFKDFDRQGKNRVVFATDLEEVENEASLDVLAEIVSLLIEPRLRVMNVRPKNTALGFNKEMERAALISRFREGIETERITVFANNVMDGINFYLDKNLDTGMIAMVARDSKGLFQRSLTRDMAALTNYPLLVLSNSKG